MLCFGAQDHNISVRKKKHYRRIGVNIDQCTGDSSKRELSSSPHATSFHPVESAGTSCSTLVIILISRNLFASCGMERNLLPLRFDHLHAHLQHYLCMISFAGVHFKFYREKNRHHLLPYACKHLQTHFDHSLSMIGFTVLPRYQHDLCTQKISHDLSDQSYFSLP